MSDVRTGSENLSFFDLYRSGAVEAGAIDEWVGRWHGGTDQVAMGRELHDYLGLSLSEYQLWVYDPDALPWILDARRSGQALEEAVKARFAALTRAGREADPTVVRGLRLWLDAATKTGRTAA
jgi:hypothetical protein